MNSRDSCQAAINDFPSTKRELQHGFEILSQLDKDFVEPRPITNSEMEHRTYAGTPGNASCPDRFHLD